MAPLATCDQGEIKMVQQRAQEEREVAGGNEKREERRKTMVINADVDVGVIY